MRVTMFIGSVRERSDGVGSRRFGPAPQRRCRPDRLRFLNDLEQVPSVAVVRCRDLSRDPIYRSLADVN